MFQPIEKHIYAVADVKLCDFHFNRTVVYQLIRIIYVQSKAIFDPMFDDLIFSY